MREFILRMLGPDAQHLPDPDELTCDAAPPPGLPPGVKCRFRRGHACPCRYFGDIERGGLGEP